MKLPVSLFQEHSVPLIPDGRPYLTAIHSCKTVLMSRSSEPEQPCDSAHRVGYTGDQVDALAIYRVRVRFRYGAVMLPVVCVPGRDFCCL